MSQVTMMTEMSSVRVKLDLDAKKVLGYSYDEDSTEKSIPKYIKFTKDYWPIINGKTFDMTAKSLTREQIK